MAKNWLNLTLSVKRTALIKCVKFSQWLKWANFNDDELETERNIVTAKKVRSETDSLSYGT
jgi:hypothetical protein